MRRFEDFIHHIDQPSIDGFNTFTVSSLARESGMKVVLSGLGGDEIFAGYPSFAKVPRLVAYARLLDRIPGIRHRLGKGLEAHTTSPRLQRLGTFLQSANTVRNAYRAFRGVFSRRAACRLTARTLGLSLPDLLHGQLEETPLLSAPTPRDEVSLCELSLYMRNQLLKDSDVMSMSQGLELRVPFVDRTLFDSVAGIPAAIRLRQGKQLLIEALPEIPQWVVNQPKRGFLFPYQRWAYTTWGGLFAEANARIPINQPTWYQSWAVFMLDRWLEQRGLSPGGSR
jgi:asparagine synthase (glutamine-hydrolysing)